MSGLDRFSDAVLFAALSLYPALIAACVAFKSMRYSRQDISCLSVSAMDLPMDKMMNFELFDSIFNNGVVPDSMIAASVSDDDVGVLLRTHLISERFLQGYISAAINEGDLFSGESRDKDKCKMSYFSKLNCAKHHGLPGPTFDALKALNDGRNDMAHEIGKDKISASLLDAIEASCLRITSHTDISLDDHHLQTWDENGQPIAIYRYGDMQTPPRVKLLMLFGCLVRRTLESKGKLMASAATAATFTPTKNHLHPKITYSTTLSLKSN